MFMYMLCELYAFLNKFSLNLTCLRPVLVPQTIRAASLENRLFAYAKTKTQISFAVTAKLISVFVFAIRIVQALYYLNPKFQASSDLLWLYSPVCVGPGRKPRRPVFSERGSYYNKISKDQKLVQSESTFLKHSVCMENRWNCCSFPDDGHPPTYITQKNIYLIRFNDK